MCYHASLTAKKLELEQRFQPDLTDIPGWEPVYHASAFSLPQWPVVHSKEGQVHLELFQWGLIPFWVKDEQSAAQLRMKTFNARSETMAEKPSFRSAFKSNRCLVPFSGFFEWHTKGSKKFPYFIRLKEAQTGAFAGLYDTWTNKATGEMVRSYSVVTTAANPLMEHIHNTKKRMPLILPPEVEQLWLDPALPTADVLALARPFAEESMDAWTITKRITSRTEDPNVPAVIDRQTYPELSEQGSLF